MYDDLTDPLYKKFAQLVYEKTGIHLHDGKKQLLQARISKLLRRKNLDSFHQYYEMLTNERGNTLLLEFINAVSTNTTYFFREEKHFDFMRSVWGPQIKSLRDVKIWCAAASSGEEPYSLAMTMAEMYPTKPCKIIASDIDTDMLATGERGIYSEDKVEKLPPQLLQRYFLKGKDRSAGFVKAKEILRKMIEFKTINLINSFSFAQPFDLISIRNVMIYFKTETKADIVNRMFYNLKPGGYLFIGHSESLNGVTDRYRYIQPAIYQRPE